MKTFRSILSTGAIGALALSLAACGPDDYSPAAALALGDGGFQPGWSMNDLAGIDPAFLGNGVPDYPRALPMQASWDGDYPSAPTFDYAPDYADSYYEPLDQGYYEPDSSGGLGDVALLALAAALGGMLGQSPPDYGFDYYDGVQPWGWTTADRYVRYAEPVYGGYRYYYYEPDTYRPFYVQDPYYGYGYRDDRLVVIYDRDGRRIDARRAERQRLAARSYFARGEQLYRVGEDAHRYGVPADLWNRRRETFVRDNNKWTKVRARRPVWQEWERNEGVKYHREWADEALMRRGAERSFAGWQKASYRTEAPRFYTPDARRVQLQKVADMRQVAAQAQRERQLQAQQAKLVRHEDRAQVRAGRPRKVQQVAFAGQPGQKRLPLKAEQQDRQQAQAAQHQLRQQQEAAQAEARRDAAGHQRQLQAVKAQQQREVRDARAAQKRQQAAHGEQQRQQQVARAEQQRRQQAARAEQGKQQKARAEQQRAQSQAKAQQQQARAEQQRQQQARAEQQRAQSQAKARQQQARAEQQRQQQVRAEQQRAQSQARAQQQRAEAQRQQQAQAQAQARAQQQAARAEQQRQQQAQARAARQQQQQAQAARQQQAQAQARAVQQPAAANAPQHGNGKQNGRGKG